MERSRDAGSIPAASTPQPLFQKGVADFYLALRQNLWVKMMDFAKEDSGLRPEGFFAFVPIPKMGEKDAPARIAGAPLGLGP